MKGILGFAALLALGAGLFVTPRSAQADTISCGSVDHRRTTCSVPWRDARLVRQDSRSACIRGDTWGMTRRGIWVDDGCRGIFEDARGWRDDRRYRDDRRWRDDHYYDHHHHYDHH